MMIFGYINVYVMIDNITAFDYIMLSKYNYSPSAASLRLNKSTSAQKFYRQATERSLNYESALQSPSRDCLACRHEQKIPSKAVSNISQTLDRHENLSAARQEYYPQPVQHQMDNLRKSIRYLQDFIQKNKRQYRVALGRNEQKVNQLTKQLQEKGGIISELQRKNSANQMLQQYASASMVGTYFEKQDAQEKERLNAKIRQLGKMIQGLQLENESLKKVPKLRKQQAVAVEALKQRVRECQVYAREYQSMKLLIHKMEMEKQDIFKKHQKAISDLSKIHSQQIKELQDLIEDVREELNEREKQLQGKQREIQRTRFATEGANHTQWQHLQQLLQEKNEEVDKLQSKLNCVESELTYLKNRYGYLLKMIKNSPQEPVSTSQLEDYCIQRIGRHNISNGKESLMGLNLSPIKRR